MNLFRRRTPEPPPADPTAIVIGLIDATVCLAQTLVAADILSREQLAQNYRTAAGRNNSRNPALCRAATACAKPLPWPRSLRAQVLTRPRHRCRGVTTC